DQKENAHMAAHPLRLLGTAARLISTCVRQETRRVYSDEVGGFRCGVRARFLLKFGLSLRRCLKRNKNPPPSEAEMTIPPAQPNARVRSPRKPKRPGPSSSVPSA